MGAEFASKLTSNEDSQQIQEPDGVLSSQIQDEIKANQEPKQGEPAEPEKQVMNEDSGRRTPEDSKQELPQKQDTPTPQSQLLESTTGPSINATQENELSQSKFRKWADASVGWPKQFGSRGTDSIGGISVDDEGNLFALIMLSGQPNRLPGLGQQEILLKKFNSSGTELESKSLKVPGPPHSYLKNAFVNEEGSVYLVGTKSDMYSDLLNPQGMPFNLSFDAFVIRIGLDGEVQWSDTFGTDERDESLDLAVDATGNVYISGLLGNDYAGRGGDAFVRKYSTNGELLWDDRFGPEEGSRANSVAVDAEGNVYLAGNTYDILEGAILGKESGLGQYSPFANSSRNLLWDSLGKKSSLVSYTFGETSSQITQGNMTPPPPPPPLNDAFIRKYNSNGDLIWTRQVGFGYVTNFSEVVVDSEGNLYVAGGTDGIFEGVESPSTHPAFLNEIILKYSSEGDYLWGHKLGGGRFLINDISIALDNSLYATGISGEAFPAQVDGENKNGSYIQKFNPQGNLEWSYQFGISQSANLSDIEFGKNGEIYAVGGTYDALPGYEFKGETDAFIMVVRNSTGEYYKLEEERAANPGCERYDNLQKASMAPDNVCILEIWSSKEELNHFPEEIFHLKNLKQLTVESGLANVSEIPPEISQLEYLEEVHLRSNISELPSEFGQLENLLALGLSGNGLTKIPEEVFELESLHWLDLSRNNISTIPPEISRLENLTIFDLSWNQITDVPSEVANMKNLRRLSLARNPLSEIELEEIEQLFEQTVQLR